MDKPRDPKFCRRVKHLKIFDTCPGVFQNLDQGADGALKTVFFNIARPEILQRGKTSKNI